MSALFSTCRTYRYALYRQLDQANQTTVAFIGLNPSTADETKDDPTIRRCVGFARSWGFGFLLMQNLFAFRATDPRVMKAADDPTVPSGFRVYADPAGHPFCLCWLAPR